MYTGFRQKVENQTVVRKLITLPSQLNPLPQKLADDAGYVPSMEELGASGKDTFLILDHRGCSHHVFIFA